MFRFRHISALLVLFITVVTSTVLTASKNLPSAIDDDHAISKDVKAYASAMNIDLDTAIQRLALQELVGYLDAELAVNEKASYGGLWIQHSPQFRVIVQFTQGGEETIRPYIENEPFSDIVDVRLVEYSLEELKAAQISTQSKIRDLYIPTNSGINVFDNRVELYVIERSQFDASIQDMKIQLPDQVEIVTVSELGTSETDIFAGLALSSCTSGFSVKNSNGVKGILTAAHCTDTISYLGIGLPFQGSAYGGPYDFQWHTAPGFDVRNLAYDGTNNRYIYSTMHHDNQAIGSWVCKHGAATGYTCGYISDQNYDPGASFTADFIRVHRDGVDLSSGGDSGYPWFFSNIAYGVHTGGIGDDSYYMAVNYIDFLGLSVLTNRIYLPLVLNGQPQSQKSENPEYVNPYPSPNDNRVSKQYPPTPVPNPYP